MAQTNNTSNNSRVLVVCIALAVATFLIYWQVQTHSFVLADDGLYVTENPNVTAGLTTDGITWAFTTNHAANWHPLTWLSHMLDCELFGPSPGRHHLTSVFLHMLSSLLLFFVLNSATRAFWQSAFVAAAFALHPLHVESVAWVAERKDILAGLFAMLTIAAYLRYVKSRSIRWYLLTLTAFALGLMAKPMLVTLPFVLLLLDYWPLGRFDFPNNKPQQKPLYHLVREKVPLFLLAAASSVITFIVQRASGAMADVETLAAKLRIANAALSYLRYLGKLVWPSQLAILYPLKADSISLPYAATAALLLLAVTILLFKLRRKQKHLLVGWLWYLGMLVPVIGLVQVGTQAMADRYTYLPSIGIFIMAAWALPKLVPEFEYRKTVIIVCSMAVLFAWGYLARLQTGHWRNSVTLFQHALRVTEPSSEIQSSLGVALAREGRIDESITHFAKAVKLNPDYAKAHYNMGNALLFQGKPEQAVDHLRRAVSLKPDFQKARARLAEALKQRDKQNQIRK